MRWADVRTDADGLVLPVTDMDEYDAEMLAAGFVFEDDEGDGEDEGETEVTLLAEEANGAPTGGSPVASRFSST